MTISCKGRTDDGRLEYVVSHEPVVEVKKAKKPRMIRPHFSGPNRNHGKHHR